ncbi:hypothetical protein N7522_009999 [Penicillium canescens]|nr:hypothetical protein N7522_009999 [Penicillium canescens]
MSCSCSIPLLREARSVLLRRPLRLDGQKTDEQADDHDEDDQRRTGTHLHDLITSLRKARSLAGTHVK